MKSHLKSILSLFVATTMLLSSFVSVNGATYGDVNNDGSVTSSDASLILQHVLDSGAVSFSKEQVALANVTGSGSITASDAAQVLAKVLNSDYVFPVEENNESTTKETTTQTTTKDVITQTTTKETTQTTTKETTQTTTKDNTQPTTNAPVTGDGVYVLNVSDLSSAKKGEGLGTDGFFSVTANATVNTCDEVFKDMIFSKYLKWGSTGKGVEFTLPTKSRVMIYYGGGQGTLRTGETDLRTVSGSTEVKITTIDLDAGSYKFVATGNSGLKVYYVKVLAGSAYTEVGTETTTLDVVKAEKDAAGNVWLKYSFNSSDAAAKIKSGMKVGNGQFFVFNSDGTVTPCNESYDGVSYTKAVNLTESGKGITFTTESQAKISVVCTGDVNVFSGSSKVTTLNGGSGISKVTYDVSSAGTYALNGTIYGIEVSIVRGPSPSEYVTAPDLKNVTELPRFGEIIYPEETIVVPAGETFDGQGVAVNPCKFADGGQNEGGDPAIRLEPGAKVKNVIIQYPSGDGIHCYGDGVGSGNFNLIENCHWEDIGEDAMTVKAAGDVYMYGCSTQYGADKCFQINAETNITFRYVKVHDVGKFLRQNGGTNFPITVYLDNITASNVRDQFMASDGSKSVCYYKNLHTTNCEDMWHIKSYEWTSDIKSPTDVLLGIN